MPHTGGTSYKDKYLAAIGKSVSLADVAQQRENANNRALGAQDSAILGLQKAGNVIRDAAFKAMNVLRVMDGYNEIGSFKFPKLEDQIDTKISKMPIEVVARRVRDILMLAEVRIGILSEAYSDAMATVNEYGEFKAKVSRRAELLGDAYLTNFGIGFEPTESEIQEFAASKGIFNRYGITYQDLDDDWETQYALPQVDKNAINKIVPDQGMARSPQNGNSLALSLSKRRLSDELKHTSDAEESDSDSDEDGNAENDEYAL